MHGDFAPLIARFERCTAGVLTVADDLIKVFSESAKPAPSTADAPEPKQSAPVGKPLTPKQREVKEALLDLYQEGAQDTIDRVLDRLSAEKKVTVGRATLVRTLPHMPPGWRKRR